MRDTQFKILIYGIIFVMIASAISPNLFANNEPKTYDVNAKSIPMSALSETELQIGHTSGKIYELEQVTFTITALIDGVTTNIDDARVTFNGALLQKTKYTQDGVVTFTAGHVTDNKESETHDVSASKSGFQSVSGSQVVYNRFLTISALSPNPVQEESFFTVKVKDHYNNPITAGVNFDGKNYIVPITGKRILAPYLPEDEEGNIGKDAHLDIYAHHTNYKKSETQTVHVLNVNCAPNKPGRPSGSKSADLGKPYTYSCSGSDPDGSKICFGWSTSTDGLTWDNNGGSYYSSPSSNQFTKTWTKKGLQWIKVKIQDIHGDSSSFSKPLRLWVGNEKPNTPSLNGPDYLSVEDSYTGSFTASANDPDDHKVKYVFDWGDETFPKESDFVNSGQSATLTHKFNPGKIYFVRVKAVDEYGKESKWSCGHQVIVGNIAPNAPRKPTKTNDGKGMFTFTTSATDANHDQLEYFFSWGDGSSSGWFGTYSSGATVRDGHQYEKIGIYKVKAKARDINSETNNPMDESPWSESTSVVVVRTNAGMSMTIPLSSESVNVVYNMVPNTYKNNDGELIDTNGYSVDANNDGTYNLNYNSQTIATNLDSPIAVQSYLKTGVNNNQQTGTTETDGSNDNSGGNNDDNEGNNNKPSISGVKSSYSVDEGNTLRFSFSVSDSDGIKSVSASPGSLKSSSANSYSGFASSNSNTATQVQKIYSYNARHDSNCNDRYISARITAKDNTGKTSTKSFSIRVRDDDDCDSGGSDEAESESSSEDMGVANTFSILYDNPEDKMKTTGPRIKVQFDGSGCHIPKITSGKKANDNIQNPKDDRLIKPIVKEINIQNELSKREQIIIKINEIISFVFGKDFVPSITSKKQESVKEKDISLVDDDKPFIEMDSKEKTEQIEATDEINLELIKYLWDYGDGNFGLGIKPDLHDYILEIDEDEKEKSESFKNQYDSYISPDKILIRDNIRPNPVIKPENNKDNNPIDESGKRNENNQNKDQITYKIILYLIYDKDNIITKENLNEIDLSGLEILDSDSTKITIEKTNEHQPSSQKPIIKKPNQEGVLKTEDGLLLKIF